MIFSLAQLLYTELIVLGVGAFMILPYWVLREYRMIQAEKLIEEIKHGIRDHNGRRIK